MCMMLTVVYLAALVLHCTVLLHAEANMYEAGISAQHGSQCSAQNSAATIMKSWLMELVMQCQQQYM